MPTQNKVPSAYNILMNLLFIKTSTFKLQTTENIKCIKVKKKVLRKVLHTSVKAILVNIPMHLLKHQLCYLKFKQ